MFASVLKVVFCLFFFSKFFSLSFLFYNQLFSSGSLVTTPSFPGCPRCLQVAPKALPCSSRPVSCSQAAPESIGHLLHSSPTAGARLRTQASSGDGEQRAPGDSGARGYAGYPHTCQELQALLRTAAPRLPQTHRGRPPWWRGSCWWRCRCEWMWEPS